MLCEKLDHADLCSAFRKRFPATWSGSLDKYYSCRTFWWRKGLDVPSLWTLHCRHGHPSAPGPPLLFLIQRTLIFLRKFDQILYDWQTYFQMFSELIVATWTLSLSGTCRCFLDVSRQEAEKLLESNPQYGSIIIRPSSLVNTYAVTTRQLTPRFGHRWKNQSSF